MAATIDHLRVDHEVHVLAAFTDARGIAVETGASGVIRGMGLDTARMELWIEWERGGVSERLHFALRAATGPGNGRMREYFALGNDVADATPARVAQTLQTAHTVGSTRHDEPAGVRELRPHAFPMAGTHLGEAAVACQCDAALHRPVLAPGTGVNACMRCGTVTFTHTIGDEGRYTGTASYVYVVEEVSDALLQWLSRWPRVCVRRHDLDGWHRPAGLRRDEVVYLSAETRCETAAELQALERATGAGVYDGVFPAERPPESLPSRLLWFAQCAEAARLTPDSELSALITSADPGNAACSFAVLQLLRRADAFEVTVTALQSDDAAWQRAGAAVAFAATPLDPRLVGVLVDLIEHTSMAPHARVPARLAGAAQCETLLAVIAAHRLSTAEVRAALASLQRRVVRLDEELAGRIGHTLRVIQGIPEPKAGFPF